ncbi:MAG: autotransporter-associated beta strand repeat-containing protein [Akkermansia sp.]
MRHSLILPIFCASFLSPIFAQSVDPVVDTTPIPDRTVIWNSFKTPSGTPSHDESWKNPSFISNQNNWAHSGAAPTIKDWANKGLTMVFKKNIDENNKFFSKIKLDFTPLSLSGLNVESGAIGSDPTGLSLINEPARDSQEKDKFLIRYLNIWNGEKAGSTNINKAVDFNLDETFTIGDKKNPFTGVNIYSDWNINIATGKEFDLHGTLQGGAGKTISIAKGGIFQLYEANAGLKANWTLRDNSTLLFNTSSTNMLSSNLLGSGKINVEATGGTIRLGGNNSINLNNDVSIAAGGSLITNEQVRDSSTRDLYVYVNMTGAISGAGNWERQSHAGRDSTNEIWIFTGDNSKFTGNWIINADVNYNRVQPGTGEIGDKPYDYTPTVFGNGSNYAGAADFSSIAGSGAIIGTATQTSRSGSVVGFNYANDVTVINSLQGWLKIRHLSNAVLTLTGQNTHIYGTYSDEGGTIRFSQEANLGKVDGIAADKKTLAGASVVLNNGSTLDYAGAGETTLRNALFNDSGAWNIKVSEDQAMLNWDLSTKGVYDKYGPDAVESYRKGSFTKLGKGTLNIKNGSLLTEANTIHIKEGTLAFSETGTWGAANKIIITGGSTLKSTNASIDTGVTLTTDETVWNKDGSKIDGNLAMNGGTMEFIMSPANPDSETNPLFNFYAITGTFSITQGSKSIFNFAFKDGLTLAKAGYYLLFTTGQNLSTIDWKQITLTGLPNPETARQHYTIYTGGTKWTGPTGEINTVDGKNNEAYLYATPEATTLTWNLTTGGDWKVKEGQANWTGHDDSNFYDGDRVIFGSNTGDTAGTTKTITLQSDLNPAKVTVQGATNYTFATNTTEGAPRYGITGQGLLEKSGTGILHIQTSNSYSGGTRISGGEVYADATTSFGTGTINISGGKVFTTVDRALGQCALIMSGGELSLDSSNPDQGGITLNGGKLYANAELAFGNSKKTGQLTINGGEAYATVANAMGGSNINVKGGILHADAAQSLGNSTTTVSGTGILKTEKSDYASCLGTGSIILKEGGTLELRSSAALNDLAKLRFDGGKMVVEGHIDASTFTNIEIANTKTAIIDVYKDSQLILGGGMGANQNAIITKQGEGELVGTLLGNFLSSMQIAGGKARLIQGKTAEGAYTSYYYGGKLTGLGTLEFSGGSIAVTADLSQFDGTLYVNLENDLQNMTLKNQDPTYDHLYDVTIAKGNVVLSDTSSENKFVWGNLSSTSEQTSIGMDTKTPSSNILNHPIITIHQTRDDVFKGKFVNGGDGKDITTGLLKNGKATLTLSNDNTTTGDLQINEGAIQLGNGGTQGFWAGKIINNSQLVLNYGAVDKVYDQVISGTGSVDITTGQTVTFSAKNTYTGDTMIRGGKVILKDAGTLGDQGTIRMTGTSALDGGNTTGLQNRKITATDGTATVTNTQLGTNGTLSSLKGNQANIVIKGGSVDGVVIDNSIAQQTTLSGKLTGSNLTLDAQPGEMGKLTTPILQDITLNIGTMATAVNGTSFIKNAMTLAYGETSIVGTAGNKEINSAKLALGSNGSGSYNVSGVTSLTMSLNQAAIDSMAGENTLTINIFGKDADLSKIFSGTDTSLLSQVYVDKLLADNNWSVSQKSTTGDTAWWKTGQVILEKDGRAPTPSIPEPTSTTLILGGLILCLFNRRKSH